MTLEVTYHHRSTDPETVHRKGRRGVYPALILLGISNGFTPRVGTIMAKGVALLRAFEEAVEMLAD